MNVQLLIRRTIEICCTNESSSRAEEATPAAADAPELGRIQEVFWSLLSNAVKLTPPGGTVSIRSSDADSPETLGGELPSPQRLRILLVEDHENTLAVLYKLLTGRGHAVTTAASNSEALRAAEAGRFDLVLSDLGLPDGLAYNTMIALRDRFGATGIALSGYGTDDDLRRSRAAGFVEHLTKPVDFDTLIATIDRVAARVRHGRGAA